MASWFNNGAVTNLTCLRPCVTMALPSGLWWLMEVSYKSDTVNFSLGVINEQNISKKTTSENQRSPWGTHMNLNSGWKRLCGKDQTILATLT